MKKAVLIIFLLLISRQAYSTEYQEWVCYQGTQKNIIEWDDQDPTHRMSIYWGQDYYFGTFYDVHYEMLRRLDGVCKSDPPLYSIFDKTLFKKWTIYSGEKTNFTTCAYVCEKASEESKNNFPENLEAEVEELLDQFYLPQ